ncbi:hypothetical protein Goklo_005936, partial [Gossypium klotzschianum]|nr:hypothetical protein [Gossypium klotzschianum]
ADGRVLEGLIHNLSKCTYTKIRGYLQYARFLHAYHMLMGCKLDPTLISMLVEKWRLETHTFHLLCDECTFTLDDVALQFDLPVDGPVVIGSMVVPDKEDLCKVFGGKVSKSLKVAR